MRTSISHLVLPVLLLSIEDLVMNLRLVLVLLGLGLSGCAQKSIYAWGPYEDGLYESYKYPDRMETFLKRLETHVIKASQDGQKVPPGVYSEMATIYLQAGNSVKAIELYEKEGLEWPESRRLMQALVASVKTKEQKNSEN